ncbi:uncharacterized protein BJ212DRAFT_1392689 [Suillus subaureus]|uniref:Cora-domain-containing protein n=1 Tax=Suillus subaureus TaxID=48587 RepID=A0A9P7DWX2_9AGAM|nr:uncharacterized protein BJ212DRAFT_1392689 [Suillus subaureus]KAG1805192.1 hypothetical protein BJ212DRAFT_1392689 [Suillus subaureus]
MTSPTFHDAPVLSTSPTSIRGASPVRRRDNRESLSCQTDVVESGSRPHISPTLICSYDLDDLEVRERQRTLDVDMALHLSRARRETTTTPPTSLQYESAPHPEAVPPFSHFSAIEEHDIDIARGDRISHLDHNGVNCGSDGLHSQRSRTPIDLRMQHLDQTHDPALLTTMGSEYRPIRDEALASMPGLPVYQANASRSAFTFTHLEAFAAQEKTELGISSPTDTHGPAFRLRHPNFAQNGGPESVVSPPGGIPPFDAAFDSSYHGNIRQRKLSQSSPVPRHSRNTRGKMALFENHGGDPNFTFSSRLMGHGHLSAIPSPDNVSTNQYNAAGMGGIMTPGHDRPYRFSFYSNALSATIHARSLSELPAEGQSFEDLFTGLAPPDGPRDAKGGSAPVPVPPHQGAASVQGTNKRLLDFATPSYNGRPEKGGAGNPGPPNSLRDSGELEGNTWWLDVLSPTDEEMKVLSKVFSIHPLTVEDIQMEEAREKIELFRNYYLVCFRSFDQDPYSPMHLEPLNMYIIVFREGTLSFHFRPTPHPQNVRRRIKQLKDYINVTSDWISYALIDDITDAFGPLIQSIEYEVDSIDELVLILKEAEQSDMLRRIGTCRKKVMGLLRLMGNKADVVKGLAKRCNENWRVAPTSDIGLYLSDIQDHLITMTQNLNHYEKILSRSHSNYLAQISIEMTDANNQINDVLSKLTALGTVLIPMNLVTGMWGMNVHVPGQDDTTTYHWFAGILSALAAFGIIGGYTTYKLMVKR